MKDEVLNYMKRTGLLFAAVFPAVMILGLILLVKKFGKHSQP